MALDQTTLVRVLLRERTKLTAFIWAIVRDVHATDDVFQDVCLRAIDKRDQIRDESHLLAWSRRVARHCAIDLLRKRTRTPLMLDDAVLDLLENDWCEQDAQPSHDTLEALRGCIARLTPNAQTVLRLRYIDGMRGLDVAAKLGRNTDAVYKALTRIHRQLIECISSRLRRETEERADA